jgi:DNA mismatch repair protein MutL
MDSMPRIRQLPPHLVNKIAAGEVVERPASVVKELVENALDAGATRIEVALEQGGCDLIRVADNGCGIEAEDLPLAVASHATSKISTADDLFRVATLGFRGEALASIASVSRLTIRSRPADRLDGAYLELEGGVDPRHPEGAPRAVPCGCPAGTTVEVRHLFFNTPARRKFLRTTQTELGHATEALQRLALAHPRVHVTLRHQGRLVLDLPPADRWLERIERLFGSELAAQLLWVDSQDGDTRLYGYVAHPSLSRPHPRMQYLFLNGRYVRDRALQHALGEAYRGLLLSGRYPVAFLCLQMDPAQVDVNVHPTKLEVRLQDSGRVYSQVLGTLRQKFLTSDLSARLRPSGAYGAAGSSSPLAGAAVDTDIYPAADSCLAAEIGSGSAEAAEDPTSAHDPAQVEAMRQRFAQWAAAQAQRAAVVEPQAAPNPVVGPHNAAFPHRPAPLVLNKLSRAALAGRSPARSEGPSDAPAGGCSALSDDSAGPTAADGGGGSAPRVAPVRALQFHNRYLVAESEEGILVIDQHALHERILYEQLRARIRSGTLEAQALLVPEPLDLSPAELHVVLEHRETLARLGLGVEPFGGSTVLVTSYPAMLTGVQPAALVRHLAELLATPGREPRAEDVLDELLHRMACQAAVKAGDALAPEEIAALLQQRDLVADAHHCPHGRPTALVLTREELDRQFLRK